MKKIIFKKIEENGEVHFNFNYKQDSLMEQIFAPLFSFNISVSIRNGICIETLIKEYINVMYSNESPVVELTAYESMAGIFRLKGTIQTFNKNGKELYKITDNFFIKKDIAYAIR